MSKTIGVLGCGWLGFPLAKRLLQEGYTVKGSTTSVEKTTRLHSSGIDAYEISLSESGISGAIGTFLDNLDVIIVNIPPRLRGKGPHESFIAKMRLLHQELQKTSIEKMIFVSSTSVYGDAEGTVTEETPPVPVTASGKQLLQSEQLFTNDGQLKTTIIRFAGLIGEDRHPITMLTGKNNLKNGHAPVNLIHLDDCIGIIISILETDNFGELYNAVYPAHPSKKEYYTNQALKRHLDPPVYVGSAIGNPKKVISCKPFLTQHYVFTTGI